jgi:hypothetical protein
MLKLSTSFSKKVPVPGQEFSSQSYHAAVELELSDALKPEEVLERIRKTFAPVHQSVETEINGKAVPTTTQPAAQPATPAAAASASKPVEKASNKQVKFILDLAGRQNIPLSQLTAGVDGFVRDCVASLREPTARLCTEMLQSMSVGKTDGVQQKTLNRLTKFIDQFKQLNFAGDEDLTAQLEYVRREFLGRTAEDYRDNTQARERLQSGIRQLADTALALAKQDTTEIVERFGRMGARRFHLAA